MKLKFLGIIACALAFCFVLVGCNSQKTTDFTWYQAAVPDKYELNTSLGNNAAKVSFAKTDEGKEIRVNWRELPKHSWNGKVPALSSWTT